MAKKQVGISLRKPPPAADVPQDKEVGGAKSDVDAFVNKDEAPSAARPLARREDVSISLPGGREFRELTVMLPQDLARRLAVHCMEKDRDTSNMLAEVVREHLDSMERAAAPQPQPMPRVEPELPHWQRVAQSVAAILRTRLRWA